MKFNTLMILISLVSLTCLGRVYDTQPTETSATYEEQMPSSYDTDKTISSEVSTDYHTSYEPSDYEYKPTYQNDSYSYGTSSQYPKTGTYESKYNYKDKFGYKPTHNYNASGTLETYNK